MLDQSTKLCAVIGNPVEHSLSPIMHNAAFSACDLNYVYLAFRVTDIRGAITGIRALGIRGLSVTIPYKIEVSRLIDEIDPIAQRIGAVNTIVNEDGRLIGYNTDGEGAMRALEARIDLANKRVVLIGAGGAARSLAFSVRERNAKLTILNRTVERARHLASEIGANYGGLDDFEAIQQADVIIHATSVGMYPHVNEVIIPTDLLSPNQVVFDIVYNPIQTALLRQAQKRGCPIIQGYEMLVYQGAAQFELWTGVKAPVEVMMRAVKEKLQERAKDTAL